MTQKCCEVENGKFHADCVKCGAHVIDECKLLPSEIDKAYNFLGNEFSDVLCDSCLCCVLIEYYSQFKNTLKN